MALFDVVFEDSLVVAEIGVKVDPFAVAFVLKQFSFVNGSILEQNDAKTTAYVIFNLSDVNFVLTNSAHFDLRQELLKLVDKLLIEGSVQLINKLVDFDFGQFFCPQESVPGIELGQI
jgi:hypothetical protein